MDKQFDELSQSLAQGVSRRQALRKFGIGLAMLAALSLATRAPAVAQSYTLTLFSKLTGGINASGQVVGTSSIFGSFLWTPTAANGANGTATYLPDLPAPNGSISYGAANAINATGAIAGTTEVRTAKTDRKTGGITYSYSYLATIWQNGTPTAMKAPKGSDSFAEGINDGGEVVGVVNNVAALWQNGAQSNLSTPGKYNSYAGAINNVGQIAGYTWSPTASYATLWHNGVAYYLDGAPGASQSSSARGINRFGQVVGDYAVTVNGVSVTHAFLWTPTVPNGTNGTLTDLGTLSGSVNSSALGINASGHVVGYCDGGIAGRIAFVWDSVNGMRDLNTLIPGGTGGIQLGIALAINDFGQIIGRDVNAVVGFLLTP